MHILEQGTAVVQVPGPGIIGQYYHLLFFCVPYGNAP